MSFDPVVVQIGQGVEDLTQVGIQAVTLFPGPLFFDYDEVENFFDISTADLMLIAKILLA